MSFYEANASKTKIMFTFFVFFTVEFVIFFGCFIASDQVRNTGNFLSGVGTIGALFLAFYKLPIELKKIRDEEQKRREDEERKRKEKENELENESQKRKKEILEERKRNVAIQLVSIVDNSITRLGRFLILECHTF